MSKPAQAGGGRRPADAERPPVSRVGDELQKRAEHDAPDDEIERDAFDAAKQKGWDKDLRDTGLRDTGSPDTGR
jgi:hypothetical protein